MRILVADDDAVSRRLLEGALTRLGHDVVAVADGHAATDALLGADAPRLAILDWMMPGADGLAVCRAIRERAAAYVYVILLTARDRRTDLIEALAAEADDYLTKPFDVTELRARLRSGERVLGMQTRLLEAHAALQFEASHDRLTALWNRGTILDRLEQEVARARRDGTTVSVAIADLDHFKRINDTYGHAAGDAVLRAAGERLRAVLRAGDAIGRYGGEEFLIVLPDASARDAHRIGEHACEAVAAAPVQYAARAIAATASLGVAELAGAVRSTADLVHAADVALYAAKARGRNRVAS